MSKDIAALSPHIYNIWAHIYNKKTVLGMHFEGK